MNTSSRFIVALHTLAVLAAHAWKDREGDVLSSEQIAQSVNTNPVVIRRILSLLRKAGIVESRGGRHGGSRLARPAEAVTLRDVFDAVEEGPVFHFHYADPDPCCPVGAGIHDIFCVINREAADALRGVLERRTLAEVTAAMLKRAGVQEGAA